MAAARRGQRTNIGTDVRRPVTLCLVALLLLTVARVDAETKDSQNVKKGPTKVIISLAESINRSQKSLQDPERAKASREQWELALKEIRELTLDFPTAGRTGPEENGAKLGGPFTEWKLLLDQPSKVELNTDTSEVELPSPKIDEPKPQTSRFEGFASWERILQDWAEDVQEYLEKVEAEGAEYPMATFGQPKAKKEDEIAETKKIDAAVLAEQVKENVDKKQTTTETAEAEVKSTKRKSKISLPVPAPAKEGEPVLPHTDIADKSKRIWIVTTAALPWMTGTAVNPLLRAAYMLDGREDAGGSVTLMLPWLEREQDRDSVYGTSRTFETPEEQEAYIRNWLTEKAKLPYAGEKLRIEWYTAWQNKIENSVYSMGDITALIPAEDVDIMILEEPEHLNWYVVLGISGFQNDSNNLTAAVIQVPSARRTLDR